jgi:5'-nucleotidase
MTVKPQILLTNDDGIDSPGLWAAAEALSGIGYVYVIAPRDQQSGTGRSLPVSSDGVIQTQKLQIKDQPWTVFAVGGTPAQAVLHGVLEIMPQRPDLVVSGINYGENVGTGVTISGTVGAALEAAAHGIPSLAISLETEDHYHLTHSPEINFSAAAYFAGYFGRLLLARSLPVDVDVLKVEVPALATPETPWQITRLSRLRYYESLPPQRTSWEDPGSLRYRQARSAEEFPPDSDVYTLGVKRMVSVTPLSLDLTSRVDLLELEKSLRPAT